MTKSPAPSCRHNTEAGRTEQEAEALLCPISAAGDEWRRCRGPECMAWRWVQPTLPRVQVRVKFPDGDLELGDPEPPRPSHLAISWIWLPPTIDEDDEFDGGYWQEPEVERAAREAMALSNRSGYCTLCAR